MCIRDRPGGRLAAARPMAEADDKLLSYVNQAEKRHHERFCVLEEARADAARATAPMKGGGSEVAQQAEQLLKTSYETRGRKQKKEM
eukprot:4524985-Pyramimonas_sp.AAC.1